MGEFNLCEKLTKAQKDKDVMLELITRFQPLLRKYAAMLKYEDAYADLQLDFIEFIHKFNIDTMQKKDDGAILAYIKKTIHNQYIKRIKAYCEYRNNTYIVSEMPEGQFIVISRMHSVTDSYDMLKFSEYQKYLTAQEREVIVMIYYYGYTTTEISKLKRISRQAVNQTKVRALAKLKNNFLFFKEECIWWKGKKKSGNCSVRF